MKRLLFILCLLLTPRAWAEANPIDNAQESCLDKATTTLDMSRCYADAYKAWDKEMNLQYGALMATLDKAQKTKLREAQRRWIAYRDGWMEAVKARYLKDGGSMATLSTGARRVELVKNQATMLKSLKEDQ